MATLTANRVKVPKTEDAREVLRWRTQLKTVLASLEGTSGSGGSSITSHTSLSDIGTDTHDTIDAHIDDATIHFIEDHTTIDAHIADGTIHFTEGSIDASAIDASSFTAGSIIFSDGSNLAQDNANLFWDDTNNRLGVGTITPSATLDVVGTTELNGNVNIVAPSTLTIGALTEGSIPFIGAGGVLSEDTVTPFAYDSSVGQLLIGTDTAVGSLNRLILQTGDSYNRFAPNLWSMKTYAAQGIPAFDISRSGGSAASPSNLGDDDLVFNQSFSAYIDSSNYGLGQWGVRIIDASAHTARSLWTTAEFLFKHQLANSTSAFDVQTFDGTTVFKVDTSTPNVLIANDITITTGSITSAGAAIDFGAENLSTSGTLGAGAITGTSLTDGTLTIDGSGNITGGGTGSWGGTHTWTGGGIELEYNALFTLLDTTDTSSIFTLDNDGSDNPTLDLAAGQGLDITMSATPVGNPALFHIIASSGNGGPTRITGFKAELTAPAGDGRDITGFSSNLYSKSTTSGHVHQGFNFTMTSAPEGVQASPFVNDHMMFNGNLFIGGLDSTETQTWNSGTGYSGFKINIARNNNHNSANSIIKPDIIHGLTIEGGQGGDDGTGGSVEVQSSLYKIYLDDFGTDADYGIASGATKAGIWINSQTVHQGSVYGIVLDGDGAGSDIVFGVGQDASILFNGSGMVIQSDLVTATDYLQLRGGTNGINFNIGSTEQITLTDGVLAPTIDNDIALGTSTEGYTSLFFTDASSANVSQNGEIKHDLTHNAFSIKAGGAQQQLMGCIGTMSTINTIANTASQTSAIDGGGGAMTGTTTIPANFFKPGKVLRYHAMGHYDTAGSPNITVTIQIGSSIMAQEATTSGLTIGSGPLGWEIKGTITCYSVGATGAFWTQGEAQFHTTHAAGEEIDMETSSTVAVNTTISNRFDIDITWSAASASNTITTTNVTLEVLN